MLQALGEEPAAQAPGGVCQAALFLVVEERGDGVEGGVQIGQGTQWMAAAGPLAGSSELSGPASPFAEPAPGWASSNRSDAALPPG
ncbi:hypothetical protein GCM10020254_81270 [Streptomyces goshikiensis]